MESKMADRYEKRQDKMEKAILSLLNKVSGFRAEELSAEVLATRKAVVTAGGDKYTRPDSYRYKLEGDKYLKEPEDRHLGRRTQAVRKLLKKMEEAGLVETSGAFWVSTAARERAIKQKQDWDAGQP
jgi:hypothetical protein